MGKLFLFTMKALYMTFKYSIFGLLALSFFVSDYGLEVRHWVRSQMREVCRAVYICPKENQ